MAAEGYANHETVDLPPEFTDMIRRMQDAHECEYTWPELAELLNRVIIERDSN